MRKKYIIKLTRHERYELEKTTNSGAAKARRIRRARILLLAEEGHTDDFIAYALGCGRATVERTRKRCVLEGIEAALSEKARPGGKPKLTGEEEAIVIALACSAPPAQRSRWTLRLLADKAAQLTGHDSLSYETVRQTLKKTRSNPGSASSGVLVK